jgi:hypothetical protein
MIKQKARLLPILAMFLMLTTCGGKVRQENSQQQRDEVVCINRAWLKLLFASGAGDEQTMEAALKAGADVNTSVEGLSMPIVAAGMSGNYRAVQLLLDRGANVNAKDSEGYTVLVNAALKNDRDTVQLLLSKGADVNAPSYLTIRGKKVHMTPLMIAKAKGYQDIVKLLTEAGAKE